LQKRNNPGKSAEKQKCFILDVNPRSIFLNWWNGIEIGLNSAFPNGTEGYCRTGAKGQNSQSNKLEKRQFERAA
jgi:hypothetical protein